jgi:hypothetical protein
MKQSAKNIFMRFLTIAFLFLFSFSGFSVATPAKEKQSKFSDAHAEYSDADSQNNAHQNAGNSQKQPVNKKGEKEDNDEDDKDDDKDDKDDKDEISDAESIRTFSSNDLLRLRCFLSSVQQSQTDLPYYILFHSWKHFLS